MMNQNFQTEAVTQYIVEWLKNYAQQSGIKGFTIGISGGIDSAVTSTLCALTGLPLLCVEMPIHQAASQISRAKEHLDFLKQNFNHVSAVESDLTSTFELFKQQLPPSDNESLLNLTLANTRARLRMTTLYYYAGIHGYLVVGTGNKIEDFGVGFFTKYGDGGVDISPIADLLKSQVRLIGEHLQIPQSIIQAKPTDGLFGDDRSDEDQLGANYDELEQAMLAAEQGKKLEDFQGRAKEVFAIYTRLNRINQHKINPIPVCTIPNELK
ncbi:NAD(+) synthase [Myroides odoratus]|uniref:NH(3)-dependent NAD(+) synthetase n=1 Tax=Myroides odoratus TaxID=256 RepID=A0A9Q6ZGB1_MYROD|nr:NAD(+) synthase [Myroides odoratus]EHQ42323.1 NAD+ synthetase [Myroides odoratus DSM 2801]EKB09387.1 NAD+ synthetase [Myroides odoratus CIP 103059]QQT99698.1 NAD(+) synthase [Myroides odoratus]WQD58093.1 NAD(+) synthase [Myroides odoratus]STZ29583.1 NH(3)-dependent NAD(+) synthetase [Myroides odoratus]